MKSPATVARNVVRRWRRLCLMLKLRGGRLTVGPEFVVGPSAHLAPGLELRFGSRVNIGRGAVFHTDLDVGDDVMISSSVAFIGNDHDFSDPDLTIQDQAGLPRSSIRLEGDNLIGYGTVVLGNVRIGRGVIVGAGSLVTSDLPADTVCVGRPARPIRSRR